MSDEWDLGLTARQDAEVRQVLHDWQQQRIRLATVQMAQAAKAGSERKFITTSDGVGGEVKMQIHPLSYHYWGQRLGYQCWDADSDFVRDYLRDNPEARVRSRSEHLTVQVAGFGTVEQRLVRFQKTYN